MPHRTLLPGKHLPPRQCSQPPLLALIEAPPHSPERGDGQDATGAMASTQAAEVK